MSALTKDQVQHIAKLARLRLSEAEAEKMAGELTSILKYVEMLNEVDTESVEPTAQVTGQTNVFRTDEVAQSALALPEDLLACSPLKIVERQIRAAHAHG